MSAVPRSSIQYQRMSEADVPAVMRIEDDIYEFPWTPGNFSDSMRSGYQCWLCYAGSELVGYAVVMDAAGEIHLLNLSIAAAWQRRGYGAELLAFVLGNARASGAMRLFLEVRPSNAAGLALYRRFGFAQIGRIANRIHTFTRWSCFSHNTFARICAW